MGVLQKIIRIGYERLQAAGAKAAPHACRAIERICRCRTAALGGHIQECPDGHMEKAIYNSCRERSCPECNFTSVERWLDRQKARLIDCDYYHIIFTIPHELIPLWLANVAALNHLICHAIRDTLFQLLQDPKHLGGEPGLIVGLQHLGADSQRPSARPLPGDRRRHDAWRRLAGDHQRLSAAGAGSSGSVPGEAVLGA